uniref:PD-(D/E)XK nuclease family transposase n=1 Tax=Candidatus Kentrum sp. SD TaxID=2126332 RepID=A0A450Z0N4_9GAMM|nr:MAG: PD-(D/E)XK nuclease family transposase [Candidatus Kentron sp. SD]VFK47319.1 MAG: PD-(D/E)XK nuclease family transposase [Candidatus Kentron sp. SD]
MQIANPIYDVLFKYLMQNNEIATLILSTILEEEIISLDLLPQEAAITMENRHAPITVYRLDFSARIKMSSCEQRHVIIEIRKAKFASDIMGFRCCLGGQYAKGFPVEGEKKPPPQKNVWVVLGIGRLPSA